MTKINTLVKSIGLAAALMTAGSAFAVDITGAGATFPYPIYAKWAEAYKAKSGVSMKLTNQSAPVAAIKQINAKTVDFGASDMPLKPRGSGKRRFDAVPSSNGGVVAGA